jgi:hypothetical protein
VTGLMLLGLVSFLAWPRTRFRFLDGHQPTHTSELLRVYTLSGDFDTILERATQELTAGGMKHISDDRWFGGRTRAFGSGQGDRTTEIFLALTTNRPGQVTVWIREWRPRSIPNRFIEGLRGLWGPRGYHPSGLNLCIANLKQVEGAMLTWAMENHKSTNEIPPEADLFGPQVYLSVKPTCPDGGTYTVGPVGERPRCSVPWHQY